MVGTTGSWPSVGSIEQASKRSLREYLKRQRWYPAKDAGVPGINLVLSVSAPAAAITIWTVAPPGREAFRLFLASPVFPCDKLRAGDPGTIRRAAFSQWSIARQRPHAFVRAWIDLMIRREDSQLGVGRTSKTAEIDLTNVTPIHRSEVDQSNTSVPFLSSGSDGPAIEDL